MGDGSHRRNPILIGRTVNKTRRLACAALLWALPGCSTSLDLGYNDAGVPYDADCKPGTYTGGYSCIPASGSPFAALGAMGDGSISVTLVPGGAHSLGVAPDASISNMLSGTTETSSLSGVLDCSTRKLTGSLGHVVISSAAGSGTITGSGAFTAIYDADASPPALVDGVLDSPPVLGATCTWSARLE
jgi:hypothetical protein